MSIRPQLPKRSLLPRKRFRTAFYVAWAYSLASVFLATAPVLQGQVRYDATLAVLTATLISLVWYTYFTFKAVNNDPPTLLDFGLGYQGTTFSLSIQNQRHHHVACLITVSIHSSNGNWNLPPPYTGQKADQLVLKPGEAFHGSLEVHDLVGSLPQEHRKILLSARASWKDDTGEDGTVGPKSWIADLETHTLRRLYSESEFELEREQILGGGRTYVPPAPAA